MARSLVGILILMAFLYGAAFLVRSLSLPLPAPILGLLLLTAVLLARRGVPEVIAAGSDTLIRIFPLLFIPPIVALLDVKALVLSAPLVLLLAVSASTLVGLLVTAFLYRALVRGKGQA
ncbi:CidA/LrgA family protein [Kordiimonas lacus]|uniref:Holin-like protein n=1 Tax=Kordiimonas lacus TaxID=637679 RepID=A0A1G7F2C7_9PROT|nr:CidA/LrgA family protein [Kordiimonas lacus]SDE69896.1 holin-like protein [Kordiimonas lacus]